jgi:hypothetical protein
MADAKLSDLDTLSSVADADLFYAVAGGVQKKVAASVVKTYMGTGEGGGGYSEIRGATSASATYPLGTQLDPDVDTQAWFLFQIPLDYKEGTDLVFHIHMAWRDDAAGDVVWGILAQGANKNDAVAIWGLTSSTSTSPEVTDEHQEKILLTITGTSVDKSAILSVVVTRNGTHEDDTFTGAVTIAFADLKYETEAA